MKGLIYLKEEQIINALMNFLTDIDTTSIDRIEITFDNDVVDINLETKEFAEDIPIGDYAFDDETDIDTKARVITLLMSEFKPKVVDFTKGFYELIEENDRWVDAFNMLFENIAKTTNKNYYLKVVKK